MSSNILIYGATGHRFLSGCLLANAGAHLHLVARNSAKLEALARELGAVWTPADVLEDGTFERVAQAAPSVLDGCVYAVGSISLKPLAHDRGRFDARLQDQCRSR